MKKKLTVILVLCFIGTSNLAWAEVSNDELLREIKALRSKVEQQGEKISELERRLAKEEEKPRVMQLSDMTLDDFDKHLDSHLLHRLEGYELLGGLRMGVGATMIVQGTYNANGETLSQKGEDVTDASYSMDMEFEKEFDNYGLAYLHLETGDGVGVEDELQLFSNVNRDADDSDNAASLTEIWYQHTFQDFPAALKFGKIDGTILVDTNEYANDEVTQFLGRIFRNSPTIEFPDNTAGMHLKLEPSEVMDLRFLMMDADTDWEDVANDIFFTTQLNLKPGLFDRNGNYRFLYWQNNQDHTKWEDAASKQEKGFGFGLSFDQELTDNLGAFLRYGWQDEDVYISGESFSLEQAWSTGLQFAGTGWNRPSDVLALAVGQIIPSDEYKKANSLKAENEGHFEAYYNYKMNEHLTLTPDIQVIWNPYGDDAANGNSTITVLGMKGQLDF